MLSLSTSSSIASFITLFLAYLLTIGFMGFFNAWIGKIVGDSTAEDRGLLTLDPLAHFDPIGFLCLLLSGIGWSKIVPIQINRIVEPFRKLKIAVALFGETVLGLLLALLGMIIAFVLGIRPYEVIVAEPSSLMLAVQMVLLSFIFLVLFMAIARFLYGTLLLIIMLLSKHNQSYAALLSEISFFVVVILILFFARYLQLLCLKGIVFLCALLGQVTGLLT